MFNRQLLRKFLNTQRNHYSTSADNTWQSVVGLEVHAQIKSASKLFSGSSTQYASPVNNNVSLFDCAIPGTLPVLNKRCVEAGVLTALALNCNVNPISHFDRKHYFYADLPAGYQITQQRSPLASNGYLEFQVYTPEVHKKPYKSKVRIKQLQLEQDSGKSLHDEDRSLVDLNRAGVPLMEVVFEPDLKDGEEAACLIKELIFILQRIATCSCKMEEGALRIDANVSINKPGEPLGVRTEIKNIGSVRGVAGAVKYEIQRQIEIKQAGKTVINETRAWDAIKKVTVAMRDKEVLQDYRYMPEPNLPPLHVAMGPVERGCVNVDDLRSKIGELPEEIRQRLREENGLSLEQSIRLVSDFPLLQLFEEIIKTRTVNHKQFANFLLIDYLAVLNKLGLDIMEVECNPVYFGEIVELFYSGKINRATAMLLLEEMLNGNNEEPSKIVEARNLFQITNEESLRKLCEEAMLEKPKAVQDYKKGKTKAINAIMKIVDERSNHRANMAKAVEIMKNLLDK